jgi:hypothetical protein
MLKSFASVSTANERNTTSAKYPLLAGCELLQRPLANRTGRSNTLYCSVSGVDIVRHIPIQVVLMFYRHRRNLRQRLSGFLVAVVSRVCCLIKAEISSIGGGYSVYRSEEVTIPATSTSRYGPISLAVDTTN